MPRLDFTFSGYVRGVEIDTATNAAGESVDVSKLSGEQLADKLERGELFISLGDHLYTNNKSEIELSDFSPSDE